MSKTKTTFRCQSCGTPHEKWQGKCKGCGEWNTLLEEVMETGTRKLQGWVAPEPVVPIKLEDIPPVPGNRLVTPDPEMNRVLGGGIVPGSLVLLGGEPGIGKSTVLLQLSMELPGNSVLYISGEESSAQLSMRAERLKGDNSGLWIYTENQLELVLEQVLRLRPDLVIVDSIQTLYSTQIESTPGSVAQIRETAGKLMQVAKSTGIPFFLIGHITKDGALAGPKLLEHMVDTVLTFEGDRHQQFRIIRTLKNRFGSTMELGVYEMTEKGLTPVLNPSELFMSHMSDPTPGIAVAATLEGSRTLLLEIQALVTESAYGSPQRSATGYDQRRLNMMLAVLEKKCGFRLGNRDVFLNFTGGIRSEDPAVDLAVAVAVASSLLDIPVPPLTIFSAEVGLTGEIRPVPRIAQRIAEAGRMGFHTLITAGDKPEIETSVQLPTYSQLTQVFNAIFTDK